MNALQLSAMRDELLKEAKVLTMAGRERIKSKNFAIPKGDGPGDTGKYPIHDEAHARAALQMVGKHGTSAEKSKVYSAVAKKYPGLSARSSVESVKEKTSGWVKDDLPWYTTALGATGATLAANKLAPAKYKVTAQLAGALLGTAAGLEGGKAISRGLEKTSEGSIVDSLPEVAEQQPEDDGPAPPAPPEDMSKKKPPHPALTMGKSLAGLGLGMGAGYAGMKGADYALKKYRGEGLPSSKVMWAIPAATAVLGMAYPYLHQATVDKMRRDHLERQEAKRGR